MEVWSWCWAFNFVLVHAGPLKAVAYKVKSSEVCNKQSLILKCEWLQAHDHEKLRICDAALSSGVLCFLASAPGSGQEEWLFWPGTGVLCKPVLKYAVSPAQCVSVPGFVLLWANQQIRDSRSFPEAWLFCQEEILQGSVVHVEWHKAVAV